MKDERVVCAIRYHSNGTMAIVGSRHTCRHC